MFVIIIGLGACDDAVPVQMEDSAPTLDRGAAGDAPGDTGDVARDTGVEQGPSAVMLSAPEMLESCNQLPSHCTGASHPDCGKCQYFYGADQSRCTRAQPCADLFLFWAAMKCDSQKVTAQLRELLEQRPDLVVVCAQPIYPGEVLPVTLGAPEREETLLAHLLGRLRPGGDLGLWSGENLLMGGCSQGATRYPVAAGRYDFDGSWLGAAKSAACFSDGVVSISAQDRFIAEKISASNSCDRRHRRIIEAYTNAAPVEGHACDQSPQAQCPCDQEHTFIHYPGDCGEGDCVPFDSIIVAQGGGFGFNSGVSAASFAVKHWKLISEGNDFLDTDQRCEADVTPRGPFAALCQRIDGDPEHSCEFVDRPADKHCSFYRKNLATECVDWFRGL